AMEHLKQLIILFMLGLHLEIIIPTAAAVVNSKEPLIIEPQCPNADDIFPCICSHHEGDGILDLDCSSVVDEDELKRVFSESFPTTTFNKFTINQNQYLKNLPWNAFRSVTFLEICVNNGNAEIVHPGFMDSSVDTVNTIDLSYNTITSISFPHLMQNYTKLYHLDVSFNNITWVPALESDVLTYLNIGYNPIFHLAPTPFVGLPIIEKIYLTSIGLEELKTGLFVEHSHLQVIGLARNKLTVLPTDAFSTPSKNMTEIILIQNNIEVVHSNAFPETSSKIVSVLGHIGIVDFLQVNVPSLVCSIGQFLRLKNNNIRCGCDMQWLVQEPDMLDLVHGYCTNGTYIPNLDPDGFMDC
ncbi:unnamed protein product, partial [Meganyctiphanes norvegica]